MSAAISFQDQIPHTIVATIEAITQYPLASITVCLKLTPAEPVSVPFGSVPSMTTVFVLLTVVMFATLLFCSI